MGGVFFVVVWALVVFGWAVGLFLGWGVCVWWVLLGWLELLVCLCWVGLGVSWLARFAVGGCCFVFVSGVGVVVVYVLGFGGVCGFFAGVCLWFCFCGGGDVSGVVVLVGCGLIEGYF